MAMSGGAVLMGRSGVLAGLVVAAVVVMMRRLAMVVGGGFMMRGRGVMVFARSMFGGGHVGPL
jgi:hypothetical protein